MFLEHKTQDKWAVLKVNKLAYNHISILHEHEDYFTIVRFVTIPNSLSISYERLALRNDIDLIDFDEYINVTTLNNKK